MNKLIISGYLGNDPKIYVTQSGKKQAKVSLSVKIGKDWKFVPLTAWDRENGGNASFAEQYLHKKDYVIIEAHVDVYETTDESGRKKNNIGLVVDHFEMTGNVTKTQAPQQTFTRAEVASSVPTDITEDDLPF